MKNALLRLNLAVLIWAFTGPLGRLIDLNEGLLVWYRMALTALFLLIYVAFTWKKWKFNLKDFLQIGGVGFVLALHWLFFFGSIKYSNVSIALTCLASGSLMIAIAEPILFKQKMSPVNLILGLVTIGGICLIYKTNFSYAKGLIIGLIAAFLSVSVSLLNKKYSINTDAKTVTIYQLVGGFIGLTILMPIYNYLYPTVRYLPTTTEWIWLIILALICTIIAFVLYLSTFRILDVFTINIVLTLEPVYGVLLAIVIFHENEMLNLSFYIGLLLIVAAVIFQILLTTRNNKLKTTEVIS